MKIKDVIAQTELTDRAIRLYMENGLVSPSCNESYSGRKSFDFSAEDVESLKKVATLRKAGFSIPEIKLLMGSQEECRSTLSDFIDRTNERILTDTEVVNMLTPLLNEEELSVDSICKNLNGVTTDKSVPEEDIKPSVAERIERVFFLVLAGAGILYSLSSIIYLYLTHTYDYHIKYLYLGYFWIPYALIFAISLYYIFRYIKLKKITHVWWRRIISAIIAIPLCFSAYYTYALSFLTSIDPFFTSYTTNPANYLEVDDYVKHFLPDIYELFPTSIPNHLTESVSDILPVKYDESVKYYYMYYHTIGPAFNIVAEWHLPIIKGFNVEVKKYRQMKTDSGSPPYEETRGDWTLLYYDDIPEKNSTYFTYRIFAYNDKTNMVRYIISEGNGQAGSVHFELEW